MYIIFRRSEYFGKLLEKKIVIYDPFMIYENNTIHHNRMNFLEYMDLINRLIVTGGKSRCLTHTSFIYFDVGDVPEDIKHAKKIYLLARILDDEIEAIEGIGTNEDVMHKKRIVALHNRKNKNAYYKIYSLRERQLFF